MRVETHLKLRRLQVDLEEYARHLEVARRRLKLDLELAAECNTDFARGCHTCPATNSSRSTSRRTDQGRLL